MNQVHEHSVFVLDVGLFLLHFSLKNEVAEVPFFGKPYKKLFKGRFDGSFILFAGNEQTRDVAGTSYAFDSAEEVGFGGLIVASMFIAEVLYFISVCCAEVLSDDLFGDVAANILPVVARFLALRFLFFGLEHFLAVDRLFNGVGRVREYQGSLSVGRRTHELAEDGVVGLLAGKPVDSL